MEERKLGITGALQWLADQHSQQADRALSLIPQVLVLIANAGPHAAPLAFYLDHIANWPRASECWNFESGRYFGTKGLEYQRTRLVPLLPKVEKFREQDLHEEDIVIPLIEQMEQSAPVNVAAHA